MKTEYEFRFLEIDKDELIEKLNSVGATKVRDWFKYERHMI